MTGKIDEKRIDLIVAKKMKQRYMRGYPLITKNSVTNPKEAEKAEEGSIFNLIDDEGGHMAFGYIARQNKGTGWVIEPEETSSTLKLDGCEGEMLFAEKFKRAMRDRHIYYKSKVTNVFRVFNGEGDGIGGLTIDNFDGAFLVTWYSKGIYRYKGEIISALKAVHDPKSIYEKKRFGSEGTFLNEDSFVCGERLEFPIVITENSQKIRVDLNDGAMVGIFLDQRDIRKRIRDKYSKGKRVLNAFSYTGGFSVFAAAGGAASTTSVDIANRSKLKIPENFMLNGIDTATNFVVIDDVFDYFVYAEKKGKKFDLVILDPPGFAKSKKRAFSAEKNYDRLFGAAIGVTEKGGTVVASSNCGSVSMKDFKKMISGVIRERGLSHEITDEFTLPRDFKIFPEYKEGNYLKVLFIKVN